MANSRKILVVDDDYQLVEFIKAILKTKSYHVICGYDGKEGWELLIRERPDLAIIDLRMPGMSGLEFCRRVRRTLEIAQMPLIVISGIGATSDKPESFWAAGLRCDDFLYKPFDPLALLGRVEHLLRRREYISHAGETVMQQAAAEVRLPPTQDPGWREDPVAVVRVFIESWNTRDFALEYETLAEEMKSGLSREEYVQSRLAAYTNANGARIVRRMLDSAVKVAHNAACVDCLREDIVEGQAQPKDERYLLRHTPSGWKIMSVQSRPLPPSA